MVRRSAVRDALVEFKDSMVLKMDAANSRAREAKAEAEIAEAAYFAAADALQKYDNARRASRTKKGGA